MKSEEVLWLEELLGFRLQNGNGSDPFCGEKRQPNEHSHLVSSCGAHAKNNLLGMSSIVCPS